MKIRLFAPVFAALLSCGYGTNTLAQAFFEEKVWKESEAPPPPPVDFTKLLAFNMAPGLALVYGVDPASISISKSDSLVRYVMVATSASGARNVMYEAIRCSTAEVKTYARYSAAGLWRPVENPEWRSMLGNMQSKHALQFARAGACDAATPVSSVPELVNKLKYFDAHQ